MRRALLSLVVLLGLALAQGLPQVKEMDDGKAYSFLLHRTRSLFVVGLPPKGFEKALVGKEVVLVLGGEAPPAWAKGMKVVRLGGTSMSGSFILADDRYFIGRKEEKGKTVWVVVDSPYVVAVLRGYFSLALR